MIKQLYFMAVVCPPTGSSAYQDKCRRSILMENLDNCRLIALMENLDKCHRISLLEILQKKLHLWKTCPNF